MFGLREIQPIIISTDDPKHLGKVKAFLEKRGAGLLDWLMPSLTVEGRTTNSDIFRDSDTIALIKTLDSESPGAIPHTVSVGSDGKILWRHSGAVNGGEPRAKILEIMGRYCLLLSPAPATQGGRER